MKILEEFWYGNIEPTDYDTSSCKEYKKSCVKDMPRRQMSVILRRSLHGGRLILMQPGYQTIVAFLVFSLIEGNVSVLLDALLNELGSDVDLSFQLGQLSLKGCGVEAP